MSPKKWYASQKEAWVLRFQSQSIGVQKRQMLLTSSVIFILSFIMILWTNSLSRLPELPRDASVKSVQEPITRLEQHVTKIQEHTALQSRRRPDSDTSLMAGDLRNTGLFHLPGDSALWLNADRVRRTKALFQLQHGATPR